MKQYSRCNNMSEKSKKQTLWLNTRPYTGIRIYICIEPGAESQFDMCTVTSYRLP